MLTGRQSIAFADQTAKVKRSFVNGEKGNAMLLFQETHPPGLGFLFPPASRQETCAATVTVVSWTGLWSSTNRKVLLRMTL